ncbi:P-loop NTPase fold protein [uncultured Ruminococcus sp.]|uniref:KAP family P-loop NTPase fold protein n=1 Tax=uncultured Ruminococcus sp. TaxID=165186 RepID=UPI00260780AD|nr:P-loop NTPase fold protein [uncultured Ruminococcus sp.]
MKFSVLNPTEENIQKTLLDDPLGRFQELSQFVELLNSIEDSCTIALDGDWGSGKTFFIKQVQMIIDAYNGKLDKTYATNIQEKFGDINRVSQITVYYDAWENDGEADPLLSILYEIITAFDYDIKNFSRNDASQIPTTLLKSISEMLTTKFFGVSSKDTIEKLSSTNPFDQIRNNKDLKEKISTFLQEVKIELGNKLIIFVDELDRCNPTYAVKTLERIKHYFSSPDIIFVLSVNLSELQNTIKQYYGNSFNAYQYLDRFFDLRLGLNSIDINRFINTQKLWPNSENEMEVCLAADKIIAKFFHFSMRTIDRYFKQVKFIQQNIINELVIYVNYEQSNAYYFLGTYVAPILVALKLHSINEYKEFVSGNRLDLFIEIFDKYHSDKSTKYDFNTYFKLDTTGDLQSYKANCKTIYNYIFTNITRAPRIQLNDYSFTSPMIDSFLAAMSMISRFSNFE